MKWQLVLLCIGIYLSCSSGTPTDSLLGVIQSEKEDTALVANYTRLAWNYYALADSARASFYLGKSAKLSAKLHFNKGELAAYSNLAMLYTLYAQPDSATHYLLLCLQRAKEYSESSVAAKCCLNLASAYLNRADYAQCIRYYINALDYFEKAKDEPKIAMTEHCMGIAYCLMKNYPLSLEHYRKSIFTARRLGKPDEAGYSYNGLGVVYKELEQYDTALYYLEQARLLAVKANDKKLLSHSLSNLGEIWSIRRDDIKAQQYLGQARQLQAETNDQRGLAETDILIGGLHLRKNDFTEALLSFESARMIALRTGLTDILKNAWKGLSDAYHGLHKDKEALEAYRQYSGIKDSLYTSESTRQIADMQTKYNTEKKERENELLQRENEVKSLQVMEQRNQKYILVLVFTLALLVAGIYYNRYRLRQKNTLLKERELRARAVLQAQEDEKEKLSKDLHDGVGSLLSLIRLNMSAISSVSTDEEKILLQTRSLAGQAIKEVREVSHRLMPGMLAKAGLQAALAEFTDQVNAAGTLNMQLRFEAALGLQHEAALSIFRMVQEAVTNILRHASATQAWIEVTLQADVLCVGIKDNGSGFDSTGPLPQGGNGIRNLINRAALLNGNAHITSIPASGTQILIHLPVKYIANE